MTPEWEVIVDGLERLEAPCLDLAGNLCFSEMAGDGRIYRLGHDGGLETVVEGRAHVGGLVAHADGGLVATGATVAVLDDEGERIVMHPEGGWGFNDFTTDAHGNLYVGMHGERPTANPPVQEASLWKIGAGPAITHCYGGIQMTNGLGISPEGTSIYHNDTLRRVVWVSDLSESGTTSHRRVFFELPDGLPDGMAIDEEGCVWVASVGSGMIVRITPKGEQDLVLESPMAYVSALCFGGADRRDLYVTTFGPPYDLEHTGSVISTRSSVPGKPITPARV